VAWFPDSGWLQALKVQGSVAAALFAASVTVLILAALQMLYLDTLPRWALAIFVLIAIFSFAIFCARIWEWARERRDQDAIAREVREAREVEERQEREAIEAGERQTLRYLDTLSTIEKEILSYLVTNNTQSFTDFMGGSRIATLVQKGLIVMGAGVHSQMDWPYMIPNFVWAELQRRSEEFHSKNPHGPHPWRVRVI